MLNRTSPLEPSKNSKVSYQQWKNLIKDQDVNGNVAKRLYRCRSILCWSSINQRVNWSFDIYETRTTIIYMSEKRKWGKLVAECTWSWRHFAGLKQKFDNLLMTTECMVQWKTSLCTIQYVKDVVARQWLMNWWFKSFLYGEIRGTILSCLFKNDFSLLTISNYAVSKQNLHLHFKENVNCFRLRSFFTVRLYIHLSLSNRTWHKCSMFA